MGSSSTFSCGLLLRQILLPHFPHILSWQRALVPISMLRYYLLPKETADFRSQLRKSGLSVSGQSFSLTRDFKHEDMYDNWGSERMCKQQRLYKKLKLCEWFLTLCDRVSELCNNKSLYKEKVELIKQLYLVLLQYNYSNGNFRKKTESKKERNVKAHTNIIFCGSPPIKCSKGNTLYKSHTMSSNKALQVSR